MGIINMKTITEYNISFSVQKIVETFDDNGRSIGHHSYYLPNHSFGVSGATIIECGFEIGKRAHNIETAGWKEIDFEKLKRGDSDYSVSN